MWPNRAPSKPAIGCLEPMPHGPRRTSPRSRSLPILLALFFVAALASPLAAADRLRDGAAAYAAHNYAAATRIFLDLAALGDPEAQTYLGLMYYKGLGVPQNYMVAAAWYRCAGGQGFPTAAYFLGLLYDKGQGVPQDYLLAYTWLNIAVAGAGRERHYWVNIRDAVSTKLSLVEKLKAQELALTGPEPNVCPPLGQYGLGLDP